MSETPTNRVELWGLTASGSESDYAADGFGHRHTADPDRMGEIARAFKDAGFFLEMMTCEDRREEQQAMRLVYTFSRFDVCDRYLINVDLPGDIPGVAAPSIRGVFPSADWFEREVYDMYGVRFPGRDDAANGELKRILLPEDADFHPLLKDFGTGEDDA